MDSIGRYNGGTIMKKDKTPEPYLWSKLLAKLTAATTTQLTKMLVGADGTTKELIELELWSRP
jgi:hypothetical protein